MPWYAVYNTTTGELLSVGSYAPSDTPTGSATKEYAIRPDQGVVWDTALKDFKARTPDPTIDRLQDLANHAYMAEIWSRLTVAQRTKLRKAFVWLLGTRRYRSPNEEVAIEPVEGWPSDPSVVSE